MLEELSSSLSFETCLQALVSILVLMSLQMFVVCISSGPTVIFLFLYEVESVGVEILSVSRIHSHMYVYVCTSLTCVLCRRSGKNCKKGKHVCQMMKRIDFESEKTRKDE